MKTDRVVLITGAAGGMGTLIVRRFLDNGDTVIATDIDGDALDALPAHEQLHTVAGDVSHEGDCARIAAFADERSGHVDVLVNVAGRFPIQPFEELTAQEFRDVIDVNLTGAYLMIKAVHPLMRGRGWGRIVVFGSASAYEGEADQVPYVAAKAGLWGLTRSLAKVFGDDGITVNIVTPGLTLTPRVQQSMTSQMIEQATQVRALKRAEEPDDLVGAVFFLASPDADFITGQTINVDGGNHML